MSGPVVWALCGGALAVVILALGQVIDVLAPVRRVTITDVTFARLARGESVIVDGVRIQLDDLGTDQLATILTDVAFDRAASEDRRQPFL